MTSSPSSLNFRSSTSRATSSERRHPLAKPRQQGAVAHVSGVVLEQWLGENAAGRGAILGSRRDVLLGVSDHAIVQPTYDQRTLFTNIQHPGEAGGSTWPQNDGLTTPRSATVVVTKDDGGVVGG